MAKTSRTFYLGAFVNHILNLNELLMAYVHHIQYCNYEFASVICGLYWLRIMEKDLRTSILTYFKEYISWTGASLSVYVRVEVRIMSSSGKCRPKVRRLIISGSGIHPLYNEWMGYLFIMHAITLSREATPPPWIRYDKSHTNNE